MVDVQAHPQPGRFVASSAGPVVALIPAHNEERFIGSLVLAAREYVDKIVVVDDGSTDRTAGLAKKAGAIVLQHEANRGKAAGVNTGFEYIRRFFPSVVVMLDGDGQHSADDIPAMLAPIHEGVADIVIGSRFLSTRSNIPAYRQVGQHGLTLLTNAASGVRVSDSQSGFRAFSGRALQQLHFGQNGFSIESEMQFLIRDHELSVAEVPINVIYEEPAKRNPVKHGLQVVNGILRLVGQIRPLLYFGLSGLTLLFLGLLLGGHVITIFVRTKELAVGYGLLTVMLCVLGMLLAFTGVILHSTRGMFVELRLSVSNQLRQYAELGVVQAEPDLFLLPGRAVNGPDVHGDAEIAQPW